MQGVVCNKGRFWAPIDYVYEEIDIIAFFDFECLVQKQPRLTTMLQGE